MIPQNNLDDSEKAETVVDFDEQQMKRLGYNQQFLRSLGILESFISSFCVTNYLSSVRLLFFLGLLAGGPLAMWTSFLVSSVFMSITAAVLAEICSALPVSGSIYIWAAQAAGRKYGRFIGFIAAWWIATSWMTSTSTICQVSANYILSLATVYDLNFPGGISNDNIKWRVVVWILSESLLLLSVLPNYLHSRWYPILFRGAMIIMFLDFMLCLIWLPVGVSKTYGFRSVHDAFLATNNGTGALPAWNWILSYFFAASACMGFDATGHVAEETKNANVVTARNLFRSCVATSVGGFVTLILFLFCTPNLEKLFSLHAPQPFMLIYALALGRAGCTFMTCIATLAALFGGTLIVLATSRLIFAIARDGALPLSAWISTLTPDGRPKNAVTFVFVFSSVMLCMIIPSSSAFTSLMSAGAIPLAACYGLIGLLRLTVTPDAFRSSRFSLGRFRKLFYLTAALFNALALAVFISPFTFPVTPSSVNVGGVVFAAVTLMGLASYWFIPETKWLSSERLQVMRNGAD